MPDIGGIPAHPLIVHAAVAFIPLFALLLIAYCIHPGWRHALRVPVLATAVLAAVPAFLAAGSGEDLEKKMKGEPGVNMDMIHEHAEAGDLLRIVVVITAVLAILALLTVLRPHDWRGARVRGRDRNHDGVPDRAQDGATEVGAKRRAAGKAPNKALQTLASLLLIIGALFSVYQAVVAGHSGAKAVWSDSDKKEQAS